MAKMKTTSQLDRKAYTIDTCKMIAQTAGALAKYDREHPLLLQFAAVIAAAIIKDIEAMLVRGFCEQHLPDFIDPQLPRWQQLDQALIEMLYVLECALEEDRQQATLIEGVVFESVQIIHS